MQGQSQTRPEVSTLVYGDGRGKVNYNINLKAEGLGATGFPRSRAWISSAGPIALSGEGVEVLGLGDPYETGTGFLVTPVVAWTDRMPSVAPSPDEVAEVFDVPWHFLMDAANHRQDHYERDGEPRRYFWAMPYGERYIWGVTAGILRALHDRLVASGAEVVA